MISSLLNGDSSRLERIHALLSPQDAQDVPRAIKLLNLTAELCCLDASKLNPSETKTHQALSKLKRNWRGELRAETCDLLDCWNRVALAEAILKMAGHSINSEDHVCDWRKRGADLMPPAG